MVPRLHKRGKSFKETLNYVLHDIGAQSSDRVSWSLTQNLVSPPETAWFEMFETFKAQQALKEAGGVEARGRKNASPVLHYSLSWAPGETPSSEQMQQTALSSLKALGLSEHESVVVGHADKDHPHVHIVVNTVHPYNGRTASLKFSKLELSRWAEAYEQEHGIVCDARVQNNEDRRALAADRNAEALRLLTAASEGQSLDGAPYVPVKDKSPSRKEWEKEREARRLSPENVVETLTRHDSTFTRAQLAKEIMRRTSGAEQFQSLLAGVEGTGLLVRLGGDIERYSTKEIVETEQDLARMAIAMGKRTSHGVEEFKPEDLIGPKLTREQAKALKGITGPQQLTSLVGYAGTGKSTLLGAARQVWELTDYRVRGAALSGIAAEGLQSGSGIQSGTLYRLLRSIESGRAPLTSRDILVIDEAGMVGSQQMRALLSAAEKAHAKVVLVGDPEQLQAIQAGGAFRAVSERSTVHSLTGVRRQTLEWQRTATVDLAEARTDRALAAYDDAGHIHMHRIKKDALATMASTWAQEQYGLYRGETSIMMTGTNASAARLNKAVRDKLKAVGHLGKEKTLLSLDEGIDRPRTEAEMAVAIGDRLLFTKNDYDLEVRNGTLGTVEAFGENSLQIRVGGPKGRLLDIDLTQYRNFAHGYAVTIHKAQGITVDRAHVLAEANMDRHGAYVGLSRHRKAVQLHWSLDEFGSQGNLIDRLSRQRLKDTTLDYAPGRPAKRLPLVPGRSVRPLQRSLSREYARAKSTTMSSAREEREAMVSWRNRRGSSLDLSRER